MKPFSKITYEEALVEEASLLLIRHIEKQKKLAKEKGVYGVRSREEECE